jgi:hypothetical protein
MTLVEHRLRGPVRLRAESFRQSHPCLSPFSLSFNLFPHAHAGTCSTQSVFASPDPHLSPVSIQFKTEKMCVTNGQLTDLPIFFSLSWPNSVTPPAIFVNTAQWRITRGCVQLPAGGSDMYGSVDFFSLNFQKEPGGHMVMVLLLYPGVYVRLRTRYSHG